MRHLILTLYFMIALLVHDTSCTSYDLASSGYPDHERNIHEGLRASGNTSCPEPATIDPCVCTYALQIDLIDLDCSHVTEEQLQNVFSNLSSGTHFRRFYMNENTYIRVLRYGVFSKVSFNEIYMYGGILQEVEHGVLEESQLTLQRMIFTDNDITKFPFEDIQTFSNLRYINIYLNNINEISSLKSNSLKELHLGNNPLGQLPIDVFKGLTTIEKIEVSFAGLTNIQPGTFLK